MFNERKMKKVGVAGTKVSQFRKLAEPACGLTAREDGSNMQHRKTFVPA